VRAVQREMRSAADGTAPISRPRTRLGTVDVWRAHLALLPDELSRISPCLQDEELQRAARFHFQRDRDRFVTSRGLLRHILASYLNRPPGEIHFGYAPQGKPFLADHPDLHFNLSHAADVLVVAVTAGRELGVDVEQVFSEAVMNEVSGPVLSEPERVAFGRLNPGERREWFVRLWTRKEAYIKADGRGMSLGLDRIDVCTLPERVRLLGDGPDNWPLCQRWTIRELEVAPGYAAALASEGLDWRVAYFDWPSNAR
jgi:4'-phosphopantetheinyl transferase